MHKVKKSNKRPMQKRPMQKEKSKEGKRSVQYKSIKRPREREEMCEMKEAFKETCEMKEAFQEMEDAVRLHDAGEYACAVKKFKKVRKIAYSLLR